MVDLFYKIMVSWYLNVASAIMSLLQIISKRAFFWLIKYCYLNVTLSIKGWLRIPMTGISKKSVQASQNTGTVIPDSMITNLNKGILKLKLLWLYYYHNWNIVTQLTIWSTVAGNFGSIAVLMECLAKALLQSLRRQVT